MDSNPLSQVKELTLANVPATDVATNLTAFKWKWLVRANNEQRSAPVSSSTANYCESFALSTQCHCQI